MKIFQGFFNLAVKYYTSQWSELSLLQVDTQIFSMNKYSSNFNFMCGVLALNS